MTRIHWRERRSLAPLLVLGVLVVLAVGAWSREAAPPPGRHVVEIRGMAFVPALLRLEQGDTVVWVNRDIVPHTATGAGKPVWSTGQLSRDQRGRYVAQGPGEFLYYCELHPTMKGRLVVQ